MHGLILEHVHGAKYIGVTLSDDLKWSKLSVSLEEVLNKA